MAPIYRLRCLWQNFPGAPGYTNFYMSSTTAGVAPYVAFFDSIKQYLPSGTTINVAGTGDIVVQETGVIGGTWSASGGGTVTGTGAGVYAGATGAVCEWLTSGVVAGRRLAGKTYLVPLISTAFQSNGGLATIANTAITTAANTLVTAASPGFVVWARPFTADPDRLPPDTRPHRDGSSFPVVAARVPALAAVMRSRRT